MGKNPLAMQETWVPSWDQGDPLEEEMAAHSSIFSWRIPWTEEPGGLYSPWGHKESDTTERLHFHIHFHYSDRACQVVQWVKNPPANSGDVSSVPGLGRSWRREWQPSSVFLPGEYHGQRSLVGWSPRGHKESDTTEAT